MSIKARRNNLLKSLPENSLLILTAGKEIVQSEDNNFPFYVNRNFFYLTNISQANSILIASREKEYLFIDEYDEKNEKWFGKKLSIEEAKQLSGINEIRSLKNLNAELKEILGTDEFSYPKSLSLISYLISLRNS